MQKMPKVEFIYDADCPNIEATRKNLLHAFSQTDLSSRWQEWDRALPESPVRVRGYGSPSILVDGLDVAEMKPSNGANCCRIYTDGEGRLTGFPTVEMIAAKLSETKTPSVSWSDKGRWHSVIAAMHAIATTLLPKLTCPACWPAYAGILSAIGLGFVDYTPYLFPLTSAFLALAVFSLGYRAKKRRGYRPLIVGIIAAMVVSIGKFAFTSDAAMYGGIALLMAGSLWNSWPQKERDNGSCPTCNPNPITLGGI